MPTIRLGRLALATVLLAVALPSTPAAAHPLGLPGIVRIEVTGSTLTVTWVLAGDDAAALQRTLTTTTPAEYFAAHLELLADGERCDSESHEARADEIVRVEQRCARPPGTLHVTSTLLLDLDQRYRTLVVVLVGDRTEREFLGTDRRAVDLAAHGDLERGEELAGEAAPRVGGLPGLERRFARVVEDNSSSLPVLLAAVAGAVVVGAVHALSPGHGKSVAAAYLVGARGRPRDAFLLGGTVAAMHTGSVLAVGLVTWYATRTVAPGTVVDVLRVVAAAFITMVGGYLVVTRTRAYRHERDHDQDHSHEHDHVHGHEVTPFSRRGLVALGLSGGLLPSPAALVVVLAGLGAGRLPLALGLVAAFSVGLAGAVGGVGLLILRGRDVVARRWTGVRWLPLVAAYAVLAGGLILAVAALR